MTEFTEQITRGTAVLDASSRHGTGWVFHVDTDRLRMEEWSDCVVGQLFGEFHGGVEQLLVASDWTGTQVRFTVDHGFEVSPEVGETLSLREYNTLTDEWRAHIAELRFQRRALLDDAQTNDTKKEEVNEHQ